MAVSKTGMVSNVKCYIILLYSRACLKYSISNQLLAGCVRSVLECLYYVVYSGLVSGPFNGAMIG